MADLESRIATYQHGDGKRFFVATVQPTADKTVMSQLRSQAAAVVIVVDTSASQVGDYRADELQALKGVLAGLRPTDEVQLLAADVAAAPLSARFKANDQEAIAAAVTKLRRRLPLGNTNLTVAMEAARAALQSSPNSVTKSVVYLGDGASLEVAGSPIRSRS